MVVLIRKEGGRAWMLMREMRSRFLSELLMTLRLVSLVPDLFFTQLSLVVSQNLLLARRTFHEKVFAKAGSLCWMWGRKCWIGKIAHGESAF